MASKSPDRLTLRAKWARFLVREQLVSAFFERFGMWEVKEELRKKFGPDPGELETGDDGTEHLQVLLGRWDGKEREKRVRELFEKGAARTLQGSMGLQF
jgi:hypothetical protein